MDTRHFPERHGCLGISKTRSLKALLLHDGVKFSSLVDIKASGIDEGIRDHIRQPVCQRGMQI